MAAIAGGTEIVIPQASDSERNFGRLIPRNAAANLLRLAGAGVVALLLPPFLVRMLPKEVYGTWALVLQLTLYVGFLDFGIQTAVARFVAHAVELNDTRQRDGVLSTSFVLLGSACILGIAIVVLLSWQLPHLFHAMPAYLYRPAKIALLLMGCSFALGLPVSVIHAFFTGIQRNEIPVALAIANKLVMAALVTMVVLRHWNLAAMGAATALANLVSYAGAYFAWRIWARGARVRLALVSSTFIKQIASYSGSLMVWMAAMLMISGLDLAIVGMFDYGATAYYAIAATLTNFMAQAFGAIFSTLLPVSAAMGARHQSERLGALLVSSTRYGMLILLAMSIPLIVGGRFAIRLWAGNDYALHSTAILQVLLIANVIRLCALPYSTLLLGTGQQNKVISSPLAEGITNLVASVAGAYLLGAIGVAIGTLIGSFVSIGCHLFYNMPRTVMIAIDRARLIREGLLRPLVCGLPFVGLLLVRSITQVAPEIQVSLVLITSVGAMLLLWRHGLAGSERQKVAAALRLHRATS